MADKYANGKLLSLGGGGYNIWQVVPRMWAQVWLAIKGIAPPKGRLPEDFIEQYKPLAQLEFPEEWEDDLKDYHKIPRRAEITEYFIEKYKPLSKLEFTEEREDDLKDYHKIPRRAEITERNQMILDRIKMYLE